MHQFSLCFIKVKKDCLKFIKSQETKADKFKNKEKMIKSFLIPLCFWINKKANKKRPYFVGLAGGQGTGKTTISSLIKIILIKYFKLKVFRISIDDFYKTRKERVKLSKRIHPMFLTRGVPGLYTARYAGENATYEENMTKLLKKLDGVEDKFRTARFRTIISFVDGINDFHVEGTIEGKILQSRVGSNGFGYDPIFCSTEFNLSLAQMHSDQKNQISHRGIAISKFVSRIKEII